MNRAIALGLAIGAAAWGIALFDAIARRAARHEVSVWEPALSFAGAVEVRGAVARPGVRPGLAGLTVRDALARAAVLVPPRGEGLGSVLEEGARIDLHRDGRVTRSRMPGRRLLVLGLRIPLGRATAEDLEALPGVGPVTAARIVSFRDTRGPIRRVEDLNAVRGIGPKTLARIRPYLAIDGGPSAPRTKRPDRAFRADQQDAP